MPGEAQKQAQERKSFLSALQNLGTGTYSNYGDTLYLLSTEPEYLLFVNGTGQNDAVTGNRKTLADTNMDKEIAPKGSKFMIMYLKVFYNLLAEGDEAVLETIYTMMRNMVLTLDIFGKADYGQWALDELFNMPVAAVTVPSVPGDNIQVATRWTAQGIYPLKVPIVLASQTNFKIHVVPAGGAPDSGLDDSILKVSLCGVQARLS